MSFFKQLLGLLIVLVIFIPIIGWIFWILGYSKNWTDYAIIIIFSSVIAVLIYFINKKFR
ncbi:hypothetical protein A2W54_04065 [Candidatus Giovannonibacteria bacterium RIFCSPHIGHO2_02_43_13]|uniref:Uncharacterized protein n=1 Tax=Candidatus Giovannonibacteria bacterium RIFCSPHIGHO2_02_43_13 TaxID=1798330 RepID=A0A1F5WT07_9BACT|nr:MAG: hypothetical protein UW28_C0009G0010 [Parcubacteria group bacterium GW2011_GWA2_44_13]OGF71729.1 MAG: hypothetical protein A3E06_04180 [Candidatus Giovannonibacteria bacterium RIFCSPHIGHO2_12_FULL_44_42]OGF78778.1 MAG: hypothetical protein A2W54_04065 [Candidatus Giovannonibacteria bacterium RIFCSPHIGHO2_02_43_13]OGF90344.1 MAG: hypothetical protein A3I94_02045 [Candidatus Giovannonibacteria bacterium RIFCSPLOWO2_02_FULL_43_54]OGF96841.1 MAG: hypothetical protein A3H08_00895 [Candidatus